ncbi:MAG: heme-binding beta-barrel domain-containing protein [Nitrospirae bacterium]|nr:heme-binding beta-barrel domain-containing protein [Nitrospirota bacterium]
MNIFEKPASIDQDIVHNLGPLAPLAGIWEGAQGLDVAPSSKGPVETKFRERMTFDPMGPVVNGPQVLYGLRYATVAWPLGQDNPFHEEVGYWLWDSQAQQVMRCFIVPRGIAINAGGPSTAQANTFEMIADVGSHTYGIASNPFLDKAFKTMRYELTVTIHDDGTMSYHEDTQLQIQGQSELFHHTDHNTLKQLAPITE